MSDEEKKDAELVRIALPVARGKRHHILARKVGPGHYEVKRGSLDRWLDRLRHWNELQRREDGKI